MRHAALIAAAAVILAGCGGSSHNAATTANPSAAVAKTWPAKWCTQVDTGMTRAQIIRVMGQPTEEALHPTGGYEPQSSWQAYEYQFTAFYNADGEARQLDINTVDMTAQEKANLGCDETRTLS